MKKAMVMILPVMCIGLIGCGKHDNMQIDSREGPAPKLKKGMWWVTESQRLTNRPVIKAGKVERAEKENVHIKYKWVVTGKENISDKACWVISVFPYDLPPNIKNDQKEEPFFKFYVTADGFKLFGFETNYRSGPFMVEGEPVKKKFPKPAPQGVFLLKLIGSFRFDLPDFPQTWTPRENVPRSYKVALKATPVKQTVVPFFDNSSGRKIKSSLIIFSNERKTITQLWSEDCPWWKECLVFQKNGPSELWRIDTIDWQGK